MSAMRPKDIVESNVREAESLKKEWETELLELERRIDNITKLGSEQYLKYRLGEITERLRTIDYETVQKNHFLRTLVKGNEKTELTAEVIRTLINRIEIYQDHRVKVIFAFKRNEIQLAGKEVI